MNRRDDYSAAIGAAIVLAVIAWFAVFLLAHAAGAGWTAGST